MKPEPASEQEQEQACAVCGVPAASRCGGCKAVVYCGREHQKAHWKEHSKHCKFYKLAENERLGRHYVAVRRIEPGELLIKEDAALVQCPQQESPPLCLGCCVILTADSAKPCPDCGWPLCSSCTKHGSECEFTRRYRDSKVDLL